MFLFTKTTRKSILTGCLRQLARSVLLMLVLSFSGLVQALPVMELTTPSTALTIPVGTTAEAVYTVTNTSGIFLPGLSIHAPALMTVNPASTTCGSSLSVGGVCQVGVTIGPSQLPGLLPLEPLGMCAFGGQICSVPAANQRIQANFVLTPPLPPFPDNLLYVTLSLGDIEIFDTATNTVIGTIVGGGSEGIVITPDGTRAYAVDNSANVVNVIDTTNNTVIGLPIAVGTFPLPVTILPDGSRVYVANNGSNNVSVIDTGSNMVTATIPVGSAPYGLAVTPDGLYVYVVNNGSNNVSVIDTTTDMVVGLPIPVGSFPRGLAASPNGLYVYVANGSSDTVSVIETASNTVIETIPAGNGPVALDVTPDNSRVYVANQVADTVSVIETASNTVIEEISVGDAPVGVHIDPDGLFAYVINSGSSDISVIYIPTNELVATGALGGSSVFGFADFLTVP